VVEVSTLLLKPFPNNKGKVTVEKKSVDRCGKVLIEIENRVIMKFFLSKKKEFLPVVLSIKVDFIKRI
jgi:hypothetical protein